MEVDQLDKIEFLEVRIEYVNNEYLCCKYCIFRNIFASLVYSDYIKYCCRNNFVFIFNFLKYIMYI